MTRVPQRYRQTDYRGREN